jgi:hypothetical protein
VVVQVVVVELLVSLVWVSLFIVVVPKIMVVRLLMFIHPDVPCRVLSGAHERAQRRQEAHFVRLPDAGHHCQGGVVKGRRAGGSPICGMSYEWPYKRVLLFFDCSDSSLIWFIECSECVRSCGVASVFALVV